MRTNINLVFFLCFRMFSQEETVFKDYYKEDFVIRAFSFSEQHYFAKLSYNNQTIYAINMVHPQKSLIIFSDKTNSIKTLTFSNDENFLISGNSSGNVKVWDINNQTLYKTIKLHSNAINKVEVLPQENLYISAGNDGKIFLVNFHETQNFILLGTHKGIVRDFDISYDNHFLASVGSDNTLVLWDITKNKKIKSIFLESTIPTSVIFVPNSTSLLVGDSMGNLLWFDKNWNLKKKIKIHNSIITTICPFSQNTFLTGSFDGSVKKINLKDFNIKNLYSSKSYIIKMAIKKDRLTFSKRNGELISIKIEP